MLINPAIRKAAVDPTITPKVPKPRITRRGDRTVLREDRHIIVMLLSSIFS